MEQVLGWLKANEEKQVADLARLVSIQSISTDGAHQKEMEAGACHAR